MSRPPSRPGDPHPPSRRPRPPGKHGSPDERKGSQARPTPGKPRPERDRDRRPDTPGERPRVRPDQPREAPRPERRPPWLRRTDPEDEDRILIWGIHAVEAALRNPEREVRRLLVTDNAAHRLGEALTSRPLTPQSVGPRELDRELGNDTVHQGVLLETGPLPEPVLEAVLASGPQPVVVVLDQITDPHNVGAILRSAAAFGVAAVIMTRRHSPPPAGALAKSASGALELVPLMRVANLARILTELGDQAVMRLGLDGEAETALEDVISTERPPEGAIALVLGAEERGLRRLSKEHCDMLVSLATPGALKSLNVSNAAAIALHHIALAGRGR